MAVKSECFDDAGRILTAVREIVLLSQQEEVDLLETVPLDRLTETHLERYRRRQQRISDLMWRNQPNLPCGLVLRSGRLAENELVLNSLGSWKSERNSPRERNCTCAVLLRIEELLMR